jgi:hypothetical protein
MGFFATVRVSSVKTTAWVLNKAISTQSPSDGVAQTDCYALYFPWKMHAGFESLRLALPKKPKRIGVSFPSPEERNSYSLGNDSLFRYFEFRKMDQVRKISDSECYIPPTAGIIWILIRIIVSEIAMILILCDLHGSWRCELPYFPKVL